MVAYTHFRLGHYPRIRVANLWLAIFLIGPFVFAGTCVLAQTPQATPPAPGPPRALIIPTASERTLSNGLRVIAIRRANSPLITAQVIIKNGAEMDPPNLAGLTHLTASLLTLGTKTRSATQIAEAIEALGGSQDSEAQWDSSTVSVEVMSDKIDPALKIFSDVVQHPAFAPDEIERLRQQYIDYINVQLGEPGSIASFAGQLVLFGDSAYGHPLGGTPESLKRIQRADIIRLHQKLFRPDNAILVIGGDVNPDDAFKLAEKYFATWRGPYPENVIKTANITVANRRRVVVIDKPDAGQAAVLVVSAGISRLDPTFFNGIVANSVLDGYSGRLNQEVRVKRGLSYGAGSYLEARHSIGPFVATAQTRNDAAAQVAELLLAEMDKLATAEVTDADLVPRKAVLTGAFARGLEQVNGLVSDVSFQALMGLPLDESNRYLGNVQRVTTKGVRDFAAAHLNSRAASIVIVGNAKAFFSSLQKSFKDIDVIPINRLDLNNANLRKSALKNGRRRR
jgi:zinc protease